MGRFSGVLQGNIFLLFFVDYCSQWVERFSLLKATAEIVSQILVREILTHFLGVQITSCQIEDLSLFLLCFKNFVHHGTSD